MRGYRGRMNSRGYIGLGVLCAVVGLFVLMGAQSNDDVMDSLTQTQTAFGLTPDGGGDTGATIAAVVLFVVAGVLVLIGAIGTGVKAGKRED